MFYLFTDNKTFKNPVILLFKINKRTLKTIFSPNIKEFAFKKLSGLLKLHWTLLPSFTNNIVNKDYKHNITFHVQLQVTWFRIVWQRSMTEEMAWSIANFVIMQRENNPVYSNLNKYYYNGVGLYYTQIHHSLNYSQHHYPYAWFNLNYTAKWCIFSIKL